MSKFDLIADIHGRYDKLEALLGRMGYFHDGVSFIPPAGHTAIFVGDLIDPKPGHRLPGGVRRVLDAVKAMADRGHALVVMGNHEFNAICFHTKGADDKWLRERGPANRKNHGGTLEDFEKWDDPAGEWLSLWLPWMKSLPFRLDLGALRVIHACWHPEHFKTLDGRTLHDHDFLVACADKGTPEGRAIEILLKGVEVPLPEPHTFTDHTGKARREFRARWWKRPGRDVTSRGLVFPANPDFPDQPVPEHAHALFSPYPADAPPVFFGHYFKPADSPLEAEVSNVACLDHAAATGGPLVAYRWKGEATLNPNHYATSS